MTLSMSADVEKTQAFVSSRKEQALAGQASGKPYLSDKSIPVPQDKSQVQ